MNYYDSTYRELQIELKRRGLNAKGKRGELIRKLEEADETEVDYNGANGANGANSANEPIEKTFHVRTMIGVWHQVTLQNDQSIRDLFEEISDRTGALIDQIRLSTQEGVELNPNISVGDFEFGEIYLNMILRLRSRRR